MKKDQARERAIDLYNEMQSIQHISLGEIMLYQNEIRKIGKRAGLLREFRENGLI
jgi:hypothetical protein